VDKSESGARVRMKKNKLNLFFLYFFFLTPSKQTAPHFYISSKSGDDSRTNTWAQISQHRGNHPIKSGLALGAGDHAV
jgi:hypothetical protein